MDEVTSERWLPVVGYEENYLVSNWGNVWSRPRATTRGGLLKLQDAKHGYKIVRLTLNGKQKTKKVHQLVLEAFGPPRPEGALCRHLDGDPSNNRWPENLCWGTYPENAEDSRRHGTMAHANDTHCSKGHEYTPENLYWTTKHGRVCRICQRIAARDCQRLRRAALRKFGVERLSDLTPEQRSLLNT